MAVNMKGISDNMRDDSNKSINNVYMDFTIKWDQLLNNNHMRNVV